MGFVGSLSYGRGTLLTKSQCCGRFGRRPAIARRNLVVVCQSASAVEQPALANLKLFEYIDESGIIPYPEEELGKVGVYAVYDQDKTPVYLGKSRDVGNSLRMHLARMPDHCYFFKVRYPFAPADCTRCEFSLRPKPDFEPKQVYNFARPSRTLFDDMINAWTEELGSSPPGNADPELKRRWENAIDIRDYEFTDEEAKELEAVNPGSEARIYKKICRRIQKDVEAKLADRKLTERMSFDPKLKDKGLLDIQSKKMSTPESL
ncbi:hypothetical protein NDN08_006611 [Rhodosorus marinus]|uniref:GIY-YIG domain-containing protein n=1 Tax=Rhodosorus marinus TaxID=101924 RepID=A0AAV8UKU6_9RHOD|nr:hypothetical protein NDN08_006611 [Rhodosorus marinus]